MRIIKITLSNLERMDDLALAGFMNTTTAQLVCGKVSGRFSRRRFYRYLESHCTKRAKYKELHRGR